MRAPIRFLLLFAAAAACPAQAQDAAYSFGALPQRSALMTAEFWNPILEYVSRKSGVRLVLKIAKNAEESDQAQASGAYDFVYSNHIFAPGIKPAGYKPILKPNEEAVRSQIVALESSPVRSLRDLARQPVGFASPSAFLGYAVPSAHLSAAGIPIKPVFGGNQEGIIAQLKAGKVAACAVNAQILKSYSERENLRVRVLWESAAYYNLPVAVHPRVPKAVADKVEQAFDAMDQEPEGRDILEKTGKTLGLAPPYGFKTAEPSDYEPYLRFYKNNPRSAP